MVAVVDVCEPFKLLYSDLSLKNNLEQKNLIISLWNKMENEIRD